MIQQERHSWTKGDVISVKRASHKGAPGKENVDLNIQSREINIPTALSGGFEGNHILQEMSTRQARTLQAVRDLEKDSQK